MDEYTENRFGYLRELSREEKEEMIQDLENDIIESQKMIKDKRSTGEKITDLYNDIKYDREKLAYLHAIMEEKHL